MSPFDIPELVEQVAIFLSAHDLTQCARVNRGWNVLFAPFVWHTVPPPPSQLPKTLPAMPEAYTYFEDQGDVWAMYRHKDLFTQMVQDDLQLATQQQHQQSRQQGHHRSGENNRTHDKSSPSLLKGCHWIKNLDINPFSMVSPALRSNISVAFKSLPPGQYRPGETLMFHFLAKCTNLQTLRVSTKHRYYDFEGQRCWKRIVRTCLPETLKELVIKFPSPVSFVDSQVVLLLFSSCPSGLQKLSLHYGGRVKNLYLQEDDEDYDGDSDTKNSGKHEEEKKEPPLFLSAMRELSVTYVSSDGSYPPSWARFLGRCDHLRTLHVSSIDQGWVQALAGLGDLEDLEIDDGNTGNLRLLAIALRVGLPNLNALCINCYEDPDEELASVLLACRAGWRSIELPIMGSHSVNVLIKHHCLTIESLKVSQAPDMSSQQMVQLLASSPCLHTFATLNEEPITDPKVPHFMVEDFVDIDHSTGKARSWLCEPTLKDFRAHITGIPRPDLTKTFHGHPLRNNMVIQEAFPGQGRKLQRLVYERLARFGRLERLQLGHEDRDFNDEFRLMDNNENVEHWDDEVQQNKCLDMSLASGLRALEGLKELKELGIMRMATAVRVEDAQWMAQSWPKLRKLSGLNYSVDVEVEAESWLRETCPWIVLHMCC